MSGSLTEATEVDLQDVSIQKTLPKRVPSPCKPRKIKPVKPSKDTKKAKELEKVLTEVLFNVSKVSDASTHHDRKEVESDCEDDIFVDFEDFEEYPCELDFYNWKYGKVCRKKRSLPHGTVLHSRKYSRKNSYRATLDKVNYSNSDKKENLICYGNKKLKGSKVHLLKRDLNKVTRKISEIESKKSNVEKRLEVRNTPRRGPVEGIIKSPTSLHPSKPKRNYDQNQFVLRNDNAEKFGSEDLMLTLIALQDREITPEDFDLLLHLDSFVEVKTVPKAVIDELKTEKVENEMNDPCMICMEEYEMGETLKYLKCGHFFHSSCVRMWLTVNSNKCPLDGLEVS